MKLFNFKQFVNEDLGQDLMAKAEIIKPTVDRLNRLFRLGMIDDSDTRSQIQALTKNFYKELTPSQIGDARSQEGFDLLAKLGEKTGFYAINALNSVGAKKLKEKGLYMVSSLRQLSNGNLIWSLDKDYHRHDGWGIGFFSYPKMIRRMTPKGIDMKLGSWSRKVGSMDVKIKVYPYTMPIESFFNTAMEWAADNIDFEHVKTVTDPTSNRYLTKRTTAGLPDYKYYTKK